MIDIHDCGVEAVANRYPLVIDTVPDAHDLNPSVPTLTHKGRLAQIGYLGPLEPALNSVTMIMGGRSVAGSMIGGIAAPGRCWTSAANMVSAPISS